MALRKARHLNRYQGNEEDDPVDVHDAPGSWETIEESVVEQKDNRLLCP